MSLKKLRIAAMVAAVAAFGIVGSSVSARACEDCAEHAGKNAQASCGVVKILKPYFKVRKQLAADSLEGVAKACAHLEKCRQCIAKFDDTEFKTALQAYIAAGRAVGLTAGTGNIAAVRQTFQGFSRTAIALVNAAEKAKMPIGGKIVLFECSMSKPFGKWLQQSAEAGNPYQGSKMLKCGEAVRTIGSEVADDGDGDSGKGTDSDSEQAATRKGKSDCCKGGDSDCCKAKN